MDLKQTGQFIADRRKTQGLTQKALAQAIGVTDKAISRWETGRGFPDPATLPALAEALGVTITELVNGEAAAPERGQAQADSAVLAALEYTRGMGRTVLGVFLLFIGLGCVVVTLMMLSPSLPALALWGAALALAGAALLNARRLSGALDRLPRRGAGALSLGALAAALALERTPLGVAMPFAAGPGQIRISTCSFFNLLPVGYGNWFPLIAGCLTVFAAFSQLAIVLGDGRMRRLRSAVFVCTLLAAAAAFAQSLFLTGWHISVVGAAVPPLLLLSAAFQTLANRAPRPG